MSQPVQQKVSCFDAHIFCPGKMFGIEGFMMKMRMTREGFEVAVTLGPVGFTR